MVQFRSDAQNRLLHSYILQVVQAFFKARDVDQPVEVAPEEAITEKDFADATALSFEYFYKVVMRGARKRGGEIKHVAYTLTFDPALCPNTCEHTGMRYGHLNLAGQPVLYYLLLDLPKLIEKVRQHDFPPAYGADSHDSGYLEHRRADMR